MISLAAQENKDSLPARKQKEEYFRKEEILHAGKRYRRYNNYLTFGAGYLGSTLRSDMQKNIGADFHFHIQKQYFQAGVVMSGIDFLSNNNVQAHFGYGYRQERSNYNLAAYGGISYYTGVIGILDTAGFSVPYEYEGMGVYGCVQYITKLTYDIGIGAELFGEYSRHQAIGGIRIILFFSGAYRGPKQNYNPNVRSERRP